MEPVAHTDRSSGAEDDTDYPAKHAQHHGLDQELQEDVHLRRAQRLPDADLTRTLGDGDEHDVHDAGLAADLEIILAAARDAMLAAQDAFDLGHRLRDHRLTRRHDADRTEVDGVEDAEARRVDRDHDLIVGILEAGGALRIEDADDLEFDTADADHLADERAGRAGGE